MQRLIITPRDNWQARVQELGLEYFNQSADGKYWNEDAHYVISSAETDQMYNATKELFGMCMQAIETIIERDWFNRMGLDKTLAQSIVDSWDNDTPTLYGRFDFTVGTDGNYKMMEFNADTPTALFEAAITQWDWKEKVFPQNDQYNSLHPTLVEQWKYIRTRLPDRYGEVYFTSVATPVEDLITTQYLMATAREAGVNGKYIVVDDIGFNGDYFVDEEDRIIKHMFKLYPWEWLLSEQFGTHFYHIDTWLEPLWKLLLSNKAILPVLWELFPNHPNLLPSYFYEEGNSKLLGPKIIKPFFSREGCNLTVVDGENSLSTDGMYGDSPKIEQALCPLPKFGDKYACLGSWIVGDEPCGLGIRESDNLITRNESKFVPHIIQG